MHIPRDVQQEHTNLRLNAKGNLLHVCTQSHSPRSLQQPQQLSLYHQLLLTSNYSVIICHSPPQTLIIDQMRLIKHVISAG